MHQQLDVNTCHRYGWWPAECADSAPYICEVGCWLSSIALAEALLCRLLRTQMMWMVDSYQAIVQRVTTCLHAVAIVQVSFDALACPPSPPPAPPPLDYGQLCKLLAPCLAGVSGGMSLWCQNWPPVDCINRLDAPPFFCVHSRLVLASSALPRPCRPAQGQRHHPLRRQQRQLLLSQHHPAELPGRAEGL